MGPPPAALLADPEPETEGMQQGEIRSDVPADLLASPSPG
jgi:hypothetical protein